MRAIAAIVAALLIAGCAESRVIPPASVPTAPGEKADAQLIQLLADMETLLDRPLDTETRAHLRRRLAALAARLDMKRPDADALTAFQLEATVRDRLPPHFGTISTGTENRWLAK